MKYIHICRWLLWKQSILVNVWQNKAEDFTQTFAGDINDSFKLGLAVTRKSLKLYTDFYNSDVIIASPLGLRLVLGKETIKFSR